MDQHEYVRDAQLRREYGKLGFALMGLYFLLNVCVIGIAWLEAFAQKAAYPQADIWNLFFIAANNNAWGYIVALVISMLLILWWKKPTFFFRTIWNTNRPMKPLDFWTLLVIFLGGQAVFQILAMVMEWIASLFGGTVAGAVSNATSTPDTLSMFLYAGLFAPLGEELIFRGLALHSLKPHGKKFAILTSAFLFGIYHGNIVQSPYAFLIGLVLGYVTVEYSIGWAMLLHLINNLVLGDMLGRLTLFLPEVFIYGAQLVVIWGAGLAAAVILLARRNEIVAYWKSGKIRPWCVKSFIRSPGIIALTVMMVINMLLGLL